LRGRLPDLLLALSFAGFWAAGAGSPATGDPV